MTKRSTQRSPQGDFFKTNLRPTLGPNGHPTGLHFSQITSQRQLGRATRVLPMCPTKNLTKYSQLPPWIPKTARLATTTRFL